MARERKYLNEVGISETTMKTNEFEANISLARGCVMMAIFMAIIWVLYLAGVLQNKNLTLINIVFPSSMIVLTIPITFKRKYLEHKNFKFFILTVYILVITAVNVVIPKHGILLWALTIIVSCHYYSQKVSLFVYAVSSVCMLVAIYLGMLFGEWDPNLMGGMTVIGLEDAFASIIPNNGRSLADRLYFIGYLKDHGRNQWVRVAGFYYMARELAFTMIFLVAFQLSVRTHRMMKKDSDFAVRENSLKSELALASGIQSALLPKEFPESEEFGIYAQMTPAKAVGGDLYDFVYNSTGTLFFDIGDVSGKGVPASLFMMHAKTLLKTIAAGELPLDKVLEYANKELCDGNDRGMFVTSVIGKLDVGSGELWLSNAGHNPVLIKRNGVFEYVQLPKGFVLGGFETSKYKATKFDLQVGDEVFLYTDGVTEATNSAGELFGEDRLIACLNENADLSARELCERVRERLNEFVGDAEQFDDITMLSVVYKGAKTVKKIITVDSIIDNLPVITEFVGSFVDRYSDNERAKTQIRVATDELFSNLAKFSYAPEIGKATVKIELFKDPLSVSITFIDNGKPFDPLSFALPETSDNLEEIRTKGLGILIVRKSMDEVRYEYKDGKNMLTVRKNL